MKYLLIILMSFFLTNLEGQSHLDLIKNAPVLDTASCPNSMVELSNSSCPFIEKDTIRYTHYNDSPVDYFYEVQAQIDSTIVETFNLAHKVAIKDTKDIDIVIVYEYLDGIGGTLAKAHLPNCNRALVQQLVFDNYDMPPGQSTPDSIKVLYKDIKDIVTITKHEIGHLLGAKHESYDDTSLMYPFYEKYKDWSVKDSLWFHINFGENKYHLILKEDSYKVSRNFRINEFYSKCKELNFHMLDRKLFRVVQILREYYDHPIYITSSYRYKKCNEKAGGSKKSRHMSGEALDITFKNPVIHEKFINDINNSMYIKSLLADNGIRGIGLYNSHIHIDTRVSNNLVVFDKTSSLEEGDEKGDCGL